MSSVSLHPAPAPPRLRWSVAAAGGVVAVFLAALEGFGALLDEPGSWDGATTDVVVVLAAFVLLPSFAALAVAPSPLGWWAIAGLLHGVAIAAAGAMVASDDAQAGLALLWVPLVAWLLALAGVGVHAVRAIRCWTRRRATRLPDRHVLGK